MKTSFFSRQCERGTVAHRQHGAAAILVAVALTALLVSTILVFDIGNLFITKRRLEQKATMAALAGAQVLSGCGTSGGSATGVPGVLSDISSAVATSISDNTQKGETAPMMGANGAAGVRLGFVTPVGGQNVFTAGTVPAAMLPAVQVNLTTPSPTGFAPALLAAAPVALTASATTRQQFFTDFSVGNDLATLTVPPTSVGPVTIPGFGPLNVNVPVPLPLITTGTLPIKNFFATITVTQAPVEAYGAVGTPEATATSAQVVIDLRLNLSVDIPGAAAVSLPLGLHLNLPQATATVTSARCNVNGSGLPSVALAVSGGATVLTLGTFTGSAASNPPLLPGPAIVASVNILGLGLVSLKQADVSTAMIGAFPDDALKPVTEFAAVPTSSTMSICKNPNTTSPTADAGTCYPALLTSGTMPPATANPQIVGSTNLLDTAITTLIGNYSLTPSVLNNPLQLPLVTSAVSTALTATLAPTLDLVIDSLLNTLGLKVGAAVVTTNFVQISTPTSLTFVVP